MRGGGVVHSQRSMWASWRELLHSHSKDGDGVSYGGIGGFLCFSGGEGAGVVLFSLSY